MSDYRIGLKIEDITDDAGNQFSTIVAPDGRTYTVTSFDMKLYDPPWVYQDFVRRNDRWDLYLGLREVPPPAPAPTKPKRTWTSAMGLRRPK